MPQSLARNVIHLIFSTKNREPIILPSLCQPLLDYLSGTLNNLKCHAISAGGVADHVHLLFVLSRTLALSEVVEEVKKSSSKWAKENGAPRFYWQSGYGAFSVSASREEQVTKYIANQEEHHRKIDFKGEFRKFLRMHKIEWDEKYLWD